MPNNSNITLPEVENIVMQLPAGDRWALVKTLIESLQPENPEQRPMELSAPNSHEVMALAQNGNSFDFLYGEPDLYTLADGKPL